MSRFATVVIYVHGLGVSSVGWEQCELMRKGDADAWVRGTESGKFPLSPRGLFWLGGFVALTLIAGTLWWGVPHVEAELEQRSLSALSDAGIQTGALRVEFAWRDGEVTGLVAPDDSAAEISEILAGVEGVRSVGVNLDVAEVPSPTTVPPSAAGVGPVSVIAQIQGSRLTLSGTVLTDEQRSALVTAAAGAFGQENVVDRLEVSGLGAEIEGADVRVATLARVLAALPSQTSGRVVLVDENLSASLTVHDESTQTSLLEVFESAGIDGERQIVVEE